MTREEALKELLRLSYRALPYDETTPVQYLGVYVLNWRQAPYPTHGFVEWTEDSIEEALAELMKPKALKCQHCGGEPVIGETSAGPLCCECASYA